MHSLEAILQQSKSVAVIGYSAKEERPSHWISNYLADQGYRVYRVNPVLGSSKEVPIFRSLSELPETVDIVDAQKRHTGLVCRLGIEILSVADKQQGLGFDPPFF